MNALIVEDELFAQAQLTRILGIHFPEVKVVGTTGSVNATLAFLNTNPAPDIIFMDVELSDGKAFEIFRKFPVKSKVIMTTAYDAYAIDAFEAGSVDYILKPINISALERAISRCRSRSAEADVEIHRLLESMATPSARKEYRKRLIVKVGDRLIPLEISEVAYFFSEGKSNYVYTKKNEKYIIDSTIDCLESELDPLLFFRTSRGDIVSRSAVSSASRHLNGRLKLSLHPTPPYQSEVLVSRSRVDKFLEWLES